MNRLALDPTYRRVSVREFLEMDFHEAKAELVEGLIFMMAGAGGLHNFVAGNIFGNLFAKLRGSACRPYGSDQAVQTNADTVRYPDVTIYCGENAEVPEPGKLLLGEPKVIFEVLSSSTEQYDQREKLAEYREIDGLDCLVFVSPEDERIRVVERNGLKGWTDRWLLPDEPLTISSIEVTLERRDIFAPA